MRAPLASIAVVLVASACAEPPRSSRDARASATTHAPAPPPASPLSTTEAVEADASPDGWKRYLLDQKRFSAMFPASPKATETGGTFTYEAHDPAGALFMVACGPAAEDHGDVKRARARAVGSGSIISDEYPYFFGTDAYLSHVRLPDKSERLLFFVDYGGRYCTATVEVRSDNESAMRLIESFRPEPVTR